MSRRFQPERSWRPVNEPPDPLPEAVNGAMREATIELWRDLWQRVEDQTIAIAALRDEILYLRGWNPNPPCTRYRVIVKALCGTRRSKKGAARAG